MNGLYKEITEEVRQLINEQSVAMGDEGVLELIEEHVLKNEKLKGYHFTDKKKMVDYVFNATRKELDFLQPLAEDEEISEIMVNGIHDVFVERKGKMSREAVSFESKEQLEEMIRRVTAKVHREMNEANPIVDARLSDGSRVNAVHSNIALNGPILTIRKFPKTKIDMEYLINEGTLTQESAMFLARLVRCGYNMMISGGTSSGKTTFLNVLSNYIPKEERVIVIEDSAELQIQGIDNLVRLETKNANTQGVGEITIRQLIKVALRMRPDRILIGEVRGGEALDMLQAMNTGHSGSLCTGHANSCEGMLYRLETMVLTGANFPIEAIRGQIASAIDIIIHLGKVNQTSRKVLEISEVIGMEQGRVMLNRLYMYHKEKGLIATEFSLKSTEKLSMRGGDENLEL